MATTSLIQEVWLNKVASARQPETPSRYLYLTYGSQCCFTEADARSVPAVEVCAEIISQLRQIESCLADTPLVDLVFYFLKTPIKYPNLSWVNCEAYRVKMMISGESFRCIGSRRATLFDKEIMTLFQIYCSMIQAREKGG